MRSVVIITVIVLATAFGVSFLHNWALVEQNTQIEPVKATTDESDEDGAFYEELDPVIKKKLLQTSRKSVSFSVCVVDKEMMTFDLDRKHVLLGLSSSTKRCPLTTARALPTQEASCEAKKMDHHIPLVTSTSTEYGDSRYSKGRRMSVPALPLARII